jgi:hypothetical protein
LKYVLGNYFEDIRFAKFDFDERIRNLKEKKINFEFNNTIFNINKNNKYIDKDKIGLNNNNTSLNSFSSFDPFEIFNTDRMKNLNIVFRYLIRPSYQNLVLTLSSYIDNEKNFFRILIIILLSFYLVFVTSIYFTIWRPFENNLNTKVT